jgi:hypothetical protein
MGIPHKRVQLDIGVWRGVSKGVEHGRRLPALAILRVVRPQGIEGYGMASLVETLWSSWPPLAIRSLASVTSGS